MNEESRDCLRPGERFHGYVVKKTLGSGASGDVYLVNHEVLDTLYALKVLTIHQSDNNQTEVKRFLREARLASRIRHPNLVAVHDCGHDEETGLYYLVMDYVPGSSLRSMLAFEGVLSPDRAVDIVAQVASALDAAQTFKVVHRDIKPENILIEPNGLVKLVDLGIAKAQNLGDSLRTNTDSLFGTPSYISPEQAQCSADVDARADIYSLGIVFFEMLTGKCPYSDANPAVVIAKILAEDEIPDVRDVTAGIPSDLAVLIRRMTMKDRARRIDSFNAVLNDLAKLGYVKEGCHSRSPEYEAPQVPGMKTLLSGIENITETAANPLADPDEELKVFMERKAMEIRKRVLSRWLFVAGVLAIVTLVTIFFSL